MGSKGIVEAAQDVKHGLNSDSLGIFVFSTAQHSTQQADMLRSSCTARGGRHGFTLQEAFAIA